MVELVIPPALDQAQVSFRYVDPSGASTSRYNGGTQTTSYGGDRVAATIDFSPCGGGSLTGASRRAQLKAFLMALRGRQNRVYLTDVSSPRRGDFPAAELYANSDFSNGATSWSTDPAANSFSVTDGIGRMTILSVGSSPYLSQQVSVTAGLAYAVRSIIRRYGQFSSTMAGPAFTDGVAQIDNYSSSVSYAVAAQVARNTTATAAAYAAVINQTSGYIPGATMDVLFASASQCLLADGGENMLIDSDAFGAASWTTTGCSIGSNAVGAPDGTGTADYIVETNANSGHYLTHSSVNVSAGAIDLAFTCCVAAGTRTWCFVQMAELTGSTQAIAYVNLSTGAVGTTGGGANWSGVRAYVTSLGTTWKMITIVARKTNAATAIQCAVGAASADAVFSYTGTTSANAIALWRATMARSAAPTRLRATTTTAVATESQTGGSGFYVKAGRSPSQGSLLDALRIGDWIEADGQLMMVTGPFDLDASGCGFLQTSPPPRKPLADNTPIIVHKPMGRFMYPGDSLGWDNEPGLISRAQIELVQAFAAS